MYTKMPSRVLRHNKQYAIKKSLRNLQVSVLSGFIHLLLIFKPMSLFQRAN